MAVSGTAAGSRSGVRRFLGGAALVAVGLGVGQLAIYALNLVGARWLSRAEFGALATLLTLMAVGSVVSLGVQAVAARTLVLLPVPRRSRAGTAALDHAAGAGVAVTVASLVVTPLAVALLHLPGLATILVAVSLVPVTVTGAVQGIAQGREHPGALTGVYLAVGLTKSVAAAAAIVLTGDVTAACAGLAIGSLAGLLIGLLLVRRLVERPRLPLPGFLHETAHASHALFALFALTSLDLLLARHFLPRDESGLYAVGNVVTKVAFWLPQAVVVVAFPRLADGRRARTLLLGAGACLGIGVVFTVGCVLLPGLAVRVVGGASYEELVPLVWIFAFAGALESLVQYLVYARLAVDDRRSVLAVWAAVVLLLAAVIWGEHDSPRQIVITLIVVVALLCVALTVISLRPHRTARSGQAGTTKSGS